MRVGKRQQQGRPGTKKQKIVCPVCGEEYVQPFYGNDQGLKKKGVYCPNDECVYCKKC